MESVTIPCLQKLIAAFRSKRMQIIYTFIECLTKDGRDNSLDYKLSGIMVPKGSPEAQIISHLKPEENDILIPRTSCSVFNSTNINYVLRNIGIKNIFITGILTNQCVESAVRNASSLGYSVYL